LSWKLTLPLKPWRWKAARTHGISLFHCDKGHPQVVAVRSIKIVMTRFRQSAFEVIAAIVFIALGTLIVHLILSWWSASAALH
jgi:hypothetical protein